LRREGLWWDRVFPSLRGRILVFILILVVISAFVLEVGWPFVFVRLTVLADVSIVKSTEISRATHILIPSQRFIDVA
jgi:hypothetical protein